MNSSAMMRPTASRSRRRAVAVAGADGEVPVGGGQCRARGAVRRRCCSDPDAPRLEGLAKWGELRDLPPRIRITRRWSMPTPFTVSTARRSRARYVIKVLRRRGTRRNRHPIAGAAGGRTGEVRTIVHDQEQYGGPILIGRTSAARPVSSGSAPTRRRSPCGDSRLRRSAGRASTPKPSAKPEPAARVVAARRREAP